ncbi:MAG TPA: enoyl-CoA hydratase-related protein [Spirochaetales bacterium]|nr:enoyl-CoA hydratase-related protein [Spirochaetales bacterium]
MIRIKEEAPYIVSLALDRPDVYNALSFEVLAEFSKILDDLAKKDIRVLIVTGTGKSFSSGADLKEIALFSPEQARDFSRAGHEVFDKLEGFPCPVVAAVNGYALGGGCELACACDLIYASDKAKFGQPEAKVGMITGWGGTFRLAGRVGRPRAKELVFTGEIITAEKALEIGLLNGVFPAEEFWERICDVAGRIAAVAPIAVRLEKALINRSCQEDHRRGIEEAEALGQCVETEDQKEGVRAFLEKRQAVFRNR